jgi:hypothetical protein
MPRAEETSHGARHVHLQHTARFGDSARCRWVRMDQLPEVLVLGQGNAPFADRELHHDLVRRAWRDLRDGGHVVPDSAESPDDGEVTALTRLESRWSALRVLATAPSGGLHDHRLLVRYRVRGVPDSGLDGLPREARIGVQQIRLGRPFAQLAAGFSSTVQVRFQSTRP